MDVAIGESPLRPGLVVDGGEDVRLGPRVADRREHALGAAQVEQEVVDQRDALGHRGGESRNSVPTLPRVGWRPPPCAAERADIEDRVRLGGELLTATVLFSDPRGFTSFAAGREPSEVIAVLNRYRTEMSDVIPDHDDTLVAYMGDGIMAVFGAPGGA